MRNSAAMGCRSKYGGCSVSSSTTVQPTLHTSHAALTPAISITSGAIQYGVPTTLVLLLAPSFTRVATPKSASFTWPPFVVRMLAPLMSRCTTPCSCK